MLYRAALRGTADRGRSSRGAPQLARLRRRQPVVMLHGNPTWAYLYPFPGAEVQRFEDASHYIQEDAHKRVVPLLVEWLRRT